MRFSLIRLLRGFVATGAIAIGLSSFAAGQEPLFAPPAEMGGDAADADDLSLPLAERFGGDALSAEESEPEEITAPLETIEEQLEDPASEREFQSDVLVLPVDHLLGDWCSWRTELEDGGISPSVTFVTDLAGNPVGGVRQGFTEADNLGVNLAVDLDKRHGWE
jgi:hypothetical protein